MISLTCTHCQTVLSIDDAFAGGVCRCQHCGTIQTVPMHLKAGAPVNAGMTESVAGGPKALYQSHRLSSGARSEEAGSGTGLEDLADVVASSGLGGSGLSASTNPRKAQRRPADSIAAPDPTRSKAPLLVAVGGIAALVVAAAIWWFVSPGSKPSSSPAQASPQAQADGSGAGETAAGPQFCGIPLSGASIVYLIDRGDSAKEMFDAMKEATYKSVQSLGADRKFQVLLWDNGTGDAGFPGTITTFATSENVDACRKALDDINAEHQSDILGPLARAVSELPDSIVIVTAKGFELDDSFVSSVQGIIKSNPIKLYTVSLGTESIALQTLAKHSGGAYKSLTEAGIRAAAGG